MSFGTLPKPTPVIDIPRNTSTYTSSYRGWGRSYRRSWWERFNDGITDLGNWFAEHVDDALGISGVLSIAVFVITALISIVGAWIESGFWMALLLAVGACIAGAIGWYIALYVIAIVVNIVMYGFRFLFWNGTTFLLGLALIIGGSLWGALSTPSNNYRQRTRTETVAPTTRTYRCTATVLNIRTEPNTYSRVIGTFRKGDRITVYGTTNGFARISYKGRTGYVSLQYLTDKPEKE
jgi:hypothetical protein